MDTSGIAANVSGVSVAQVADQVGIAVLKKAQASETIGALTLLASIPTIPPPSSPSVGNNVNTVV